MQKVQSRNGFENIAPYFERPIESRFKDPSLFKSHQDEIDHIKEMNALMPKKLDQIAQSPTLV